MATKYFVKFLNLPDSPQFPLKGQAVIGSQVGDIVVNAPTLSPRHCKVTVSEGVFTITDEGSKDGVFVNGEKIEAGMKVVLQEDDQVLLGEIGISLFGRDETEMNIKLDKPGSFEAQSAEIAPADDGVDFGDLKALGSLNLESNSDKTQRLQIQVSSEQKEQMSAAQKAKLNEAKQAKLLEEVRRRKEEAEGKKKAKEEESNKENPDGVKVVKKEKIKPKPLWKQILILLKIIKDVPVIEDSVDDVPIESPLQKLSKSNEAATGEDESQEPALIVNRTEKVVQKKPLKIWQKILVAMKLYTPPIEEESDQEVEPHEQVGEDGLPVTPAIPKEEKVILEVNEEVEVEEEEDEMDDLIKPFQKIKFKAANAFWRLIAVGYDLLISYSLWIILNEISLFQNSVQFARKELVGLATPFGHLISSFLPANLSFDQLAKSDYFNLIAVYVVIRFLGVLGLGVTLGQYLIGIQTNLNGKPLAKRLIGCWRAFLGFISVPFIIFELGSLFGKRTLKEFLSFTILLPPGKARSILGLVIFTPVLLCFALVSPLLRGLELVTKVPFEDAQRREIRVSEVSSVAVESRYFSLKLDVPDANFLVIPDFEVQQIEGKTTLFPSVLFAMKNGGPEATFKKMGEVAWPFLLELAFKGNVVASERYPKILARLNEISAVNSNFKRKNMSLREIEEWQAELVDLLKQTFNLAFDPKFLVEQVKNYGPFWNGIVDFRNNLLRYVAPTKDPQAEVLRLGSNLFLRFIPAKEMIPYREYLISLNPDYPYYYEFVFKGLNDVSHVLQYFYSPILGKSSFIDGKLKQEVSADESEVSLPVMASPFDIIDYLAVDSSGRELDGKKAQLVVDFMYQTGKSLVMDQQEKLIPHFLNSIKHTSQLAQATQVAAEGEETPHKIMAAQLYQLTEFVEKKDFSVFESGLPPVVQTIDTATTEDGQQQPTSVDSETASVIEVQE